MLAIGGLAWLVVVPAALLLRDPPRRRRRRPPRRPAAAAASSPPRRRCAPRSSPRSRSRSSPAARPIPARSSTWSTYAIDHGVHAMAAATVLSTAGLASLGRQASLRARRRPRRRQARSWSGLALQAVAVDLYIVHRDPASFYALSALFGLAYGGVMPLYAVLLREYFGARIMGTVFGAVGLVVHAGHGARPVGGRLAVRRLRQLLLAVRRRVRDRLRGRGDRADVPAAPRASRPTARSEPRR